MASGHGGLRPGAGRKPSSGKSAYREFTPQELKTLLDSPHVYSVSKKSLSFTKDFKEMFWQRYCDGVLPKQIFEDAGFDVAIINASRIYSFTKTLKAQVERGSYFTEGNDPTDTSNEKLFNFPTPPRKANSTRIPEMSEAEMARLLNQVAYMAQEIEFLKKIILADKGRK